jgi:outer membrane lipoprotein-sorting protein
MQIFTRRPALRWLAPVALVAVVGGTGVIASTADAEPKLAAKTAEQLLVDLQGARVDGFSGTVVQKAVLGLPALPSMGGADSSQLTSLLSGTHTARVWYAGADKARFALLDSPLGETDVILNGSDVWTWASKPNEATHRTLPADAAAGAGHDEQRAAPEGAPKTPQEAAEMALKAIDPTTTVSTASAVEVAGRPAYELVLTPKDQQTLITSVKIAVDGTTSAPLRVQVLGAEAKTVAEVAFESVDFTAPEARWFTFNPPAGTKVTEKGTVEAPAAKKPSKADREAAGWSSVVVSEVPESASNAQLTTFLNSLPTAPGQPGWRVLAGTAFSAVLTDDGRVAVGAVPPQLLYDALAK